MYGIAMNLPNAIHIGNSEYDCIVMSISRRTHPECMDYWDGNWLSTNIRIRVGAFIGKYDACLRSEELAQFLSSLIQLEDVSEGSASFETMEGQLELTLTRDRQRHIKVTGKARDQAGIGNLLKFDFEVDQTYIKPIIQELSVVLAEFPVIGLSNKE